MNHRAMTFAAALIALVSAPALASHEGQSWRQGLARGMHSEIAEQGNRALRGLQQQLRDANESAMPKLQSTPLTGFGAPPRVQNESQS